MGNDRYDVIVVGAGPAGSAAALVMARNNLSVALLERGQYPGCKNMAGGTVASIPFQEILPEFWNLDGIPLERRVVSDELWLMDNDSAVKVGFAGKRYGLAPYNKFTILRYKFDNWFAQQAVKEGARLFTSCLAVDLAYYKTGLLSRKVDGVVLEGGDIIHGDIIVLAEGACASLAEKAGLRGRLRSSDMTLYVKQVMEMPSERIEERFNLERGEGAVVGMVGFPSSPAIGKAGIWTNKDSLSVVVGGYLNQITGKGLNPLQLLERFKSHSMVRKLLEGAKPVKYLAHTIPRGGFEKIPCLVDDGVMVVGDAAQMVSGRRGMDLAMLTGKYAAEAAAQASALDDYSSDTLSAYEKRVQGSFFFKDIKKGKGTAKYYKQYQDADFLITKAVNEIAHRYFRQDMDSNMNKAVKAIQGVRNMQPVDKTVGDVFHGLLNWGVF